MQIMLVLLALLLFLWETNHGLTRSCDEQTCKFTISSIRGYESIQCNENVNDCVVDLKVGSGQEYAKKNKSTIIYSSAKVTNVTCQNDYCNDINVYCGNSNNDINFGSSECYINIIMDYDYLIKMAQRKTHKININCNGSNLNVCKLWSNVNMIDYYATMDNLFDVRFNCNIDGSCFSSFESKHDNGIIRKLLQTGGGPNGGANGNLGLVLPTRIPTHLPSSNPTQKPSEPTPNPTISPTNPTLRPSDKPTLNPTLSTSAPSQAPTPAPTPAPSHHSNDRPISPTHIPTNIPTQPSLTPSSQPSGQPSGQPSTEPTKAPSNKPTVAPVKSATTIAPVTATTSTVVSTQAPTSLPSVSPTVRPSNTPSNRPTVRPTNVPSAATTTRVTTAAATTATETTGKDNNNSDSPTMKPSMNPTNSPTSNSGSSSSSGSGSGSSGSSSSDFFIKYGSFLVIILLLCLLILCVAMCIRREWKKTKEAKAGMMSGDDLGYMAMTDENSVDSQQGNDDGTIRPSVVEMQAQEMDGLYGSTGDDMYVTPGGPDDDALFNGEDPSDQSGNEKSKNKQLSLEELNRLPQAEFNPSRPKSGHEGYVRPTRMSQDTSGNYMNNSNGQTDETIKNMIDTRMSGDGYSDTNYSSGMNNVENSENNKMESIKENEMKDKEEIEQDNDILNKMFGNNNNDENNDDFKNNSNNDDEVLVGSIKPLPIMQNAIDNEDAFFNDAKFIKENYSNLDDVIDKDIYHRKNKNRLDSVDSHDGTNWGVSNDNNNNNNNGTDGIGNYDNPHATGLDPFQNSGMPNVDENDDMSVNVDGSSKYVSFGMQTPQSRAAAGHATIHHFPEPSFTASKTVFENEEAT